MYVLQTITGLLSSLSIIAVAKIIKKPCEITALVKAVDINLGCLSFPRVYMPSFLVLIKLESYSKHNFVTCFYLTESSRLNIRS